MPISDQELDDLIKTNSVIDREEFEEIWGNLTDSQKNKIREHLRGIAESVEDPDELRDHEPDSDTFLGRANHALKF